MADKQQQHSCTKNISGSSRRRHSPQIQQQSTSHNDQQQQQSTPSPPLNEQSPQLSIGNNTGVEQQQHQRLTKNLFKLFK